MPIACSGAEFELLIMYVFFSRDKPHTKILKESETMWSLHEISHRKKKCSQGELEHILVCLKVRVLYSLDHGYNCIVMWLLHFTIKVSKH